MSLNMVEVVIDSIRVGLMSQQRVVILREMDADRYLAIWIDPYMAEQITFALQEVEVARPMSHDLMKSIFQNLESRVTRVEIIELKDDIFYGNIVADSNGHTINIDSRPSDALALAVRANVPILVSRQVMDEAGIIPEDNITDEDIPTGAVFTEEQAAGSGNDENAEEHLSVFQDFLSNIDVNEEDAEDDKKEDDE